MKNHSNILFAALLLTGLSFGGCTADSGGTVKITAISPEPYALMRVGDKVDLRVEADYTLTSARGHISAVVQKVEGGSLGSTQQNLNEGSGHVTLLQSFVVPDTRAIIVFVPLTPAGSTLTKIVESRTYNITPKK